MRAEILSAEAEVDVPPKVAREWFLSLEEHPERYTFETHGGFAFEEGGFGQEGALFRTREKFLLFNVELPFELADVRDTAFWFRLRRPSWIGVWGRFKIEAQGESQSRLSLHVGSETRFGQLLLRCYPVAAVVYRQIRAEVRHIKASMERVYSARGVSGQER